MVRALMADTETIYARVPVDLKAEIEAWRSENGKTLAGAVAELLRRGLALLPTDGQTVVYDFHIELRSSGVSGSVIRHPQASPGRPEDR